MYTLSLEYFFSVQKSRNVHPCRFCEAETPKLRTRALPAHLIHAKRSDDRPGCFVLFCSFPRPQGSTKVHKSETPSEEKSLSDEKITPGPWKFSISYLGKDSCFTCIAKKSGSHSQKRRGLFPGSRNGAFSVNQPACTWCFVARTVRYTYYCGCRDAIAAIFRRQGVPGGVSSENIGTYL